MTPTSVIGSLPALDRWDFGGLPYCLEPLTLPGALPDPLAEGAEPGSQLASGELESSVKNLLILARADDETRLLAPDLVERLFWFRWITGHQVTFILWQLLARAIAASFASGADPDRLDDCRLFVRGYSLMLLYSGSCPRDVYQRVIRPAMALHHPSFSGSWAPDFRPVRGLLGPHARHVPDSPLGGECMLNGRIHEGIAAKLVPDGPSLLQAAAGQRMHWRRPVLGVLYDTFFLTLRAQISYRAVVLQLMRRLHAIERDIAANGLYPSYASSADEKPPSLRTPEAEECERTMSEVLFDIATAATTAIRYSGEDK
jgi:hypothetical protein